MRRLLVIVLLVVAGPCIASDESSEKNYGRPGDESVHTKKDVGRLARRIPKDAGLE